MAEFYKVIADIDELKYFYDKVLVKPEDGESIMICHSARAKRLTDEERKLLGTNRAEMFHTEVSKKRDNQEYTWIDFLALVSKFEVNKNAYLTKANAVYPDKSLVNYIYMNPCSEAACAQDTLRQINVINKDLIDSALKGSTAGVKDSIWKLSTISNHIKACHAQNPSRKVWIDFDIDIDADFSQEIYDAVYKPTNELFGKGFFFLIKTAGGVHALVKKEKLKFNPDLYTEAVEKQLESIGVKTKEVKKNDNCMVPLPGTYQYGIPVVVLNKEDFS